MANFNKDPIAVPVSVAAGAGTQVAHLVDEKAVAMYGTFTATYQLQGSFDNVNWHNQGTALVAAGVVEFETPYQYVRFNCTAYTSGTPTAVVCGHNR